VATVVSKDDIRLTKLGLRKGDTEFTIRAVAVPGLCEKGTKLDLVALTHIAEPGGNTVGIDLTGISADGKTLDPKSAETIGEYAKRCKDQRMGVLVRVLANVSEDHSVRARAVVTVAKALRSEGRVAYWIDGPKAGELAKKFKKAAPNLIVAAPENADLITVDTVPPKGEAGHKLLVGKVPDAGRRDVHFVVSDSKDIYSKIDKAFMDPVENTPWTPDNSVLSEQDRKDGFIALFDGKTLNGWFSRTPGVQSFQPKDGCLEFVRAGAGAIMSHDRYDNFILRFDWKIKSGGNSGVWVRAPREARASKIGFEYQIMGDSDVKTPTSTSTGSIYDVLPPKVQANKKEGEWNSTEIILNGQQYKALLNGKVVQDMNLDSHEELKTRLHKGFICFTDHGNWVSYRNIRLKKL
jgi:hypothetical protein